MRRKMALERCKAVTTSLGAGALETWAHIILCYIVAFLNLYILIVILMLSYSDVFMLLYSMFCDTPDEFYRLPVWSLWVFRVYTIRAWGFSRMHHKHSMTCRIVEGSYC